MKTTLYLKNFVLLTILLLPALACASLSGRAERTPPPTPRARLVRFNTPTVTATPLPTATATPTPVPPTPTPTPIPTLTPTSTASPTAVVTPTRPPKPTPKPANTPLPEAPAVAEAAPTEAAVTVGQNHLGYGVQLAEAKNMELAVKGGFTWAKHDLNLRDDINYIANADNLLSDLGKMGAQNVLLKLIVWNEGGLPDAPRSGDEVKTYAANAAEVAKFIRERYGSAFKTIAYEIWNEPNLKYEWEGNPNPAEFVTLVRAAGAAIHEADPAAVVVSGAPSPGGDYDDLKFLEGMYQNGIKGLVNAIGSHPYGGPWPYDRPDGFDAAGNGWPYFRKAEAQRAIMEKYGDSGTPIWATEFSWLAGIPGCDYGEHTRWQVTPEQQADYLVGAFQYAHEHWPWMGPMFVVYDFAISGRYDRCHPAAGYSLLRPDPNSADVLTPAARAVFTMLKYSAW